MRLDFSKKYSRNTLGGLLLHLFVAATSIVLLCVLYFYVYLPGVTNHGWTITVPDVQGRSLDEAAKFLEEHDLRYEISDSSYSSEYPPLTVLKQVPVAGSKVKENRKIYVSVNRVTPPTVPLPNLIDRGLANAEAALRSSELKRGKIELVRGPWLHFVTEMKIKGVSVKPGLRVPKGTAVDLVVMDGGSDQLPDGMIEVVGKSFDDAKFVILGSFLNVGNVQLVGEDTTGQNPVVIKQDPIPGEKVRAGDVVDLWVGVPGTDPDESSNDDDGIDR